MSLYMSKQTEENFINTTWAAKTIQGWKDGATKAQMALYYPDDFPNDAAGQWDRLRKVSAMSGEQNIVVKSMFRQSMPTVDKKGKPTRKEFLTWSGELQVTNSYGIPYSMEFLIGKYNIPKVVKNNNQKWDPNTGQPLHPEYILSGVETVYDIELPQDVAKRKKMIDEIIGDNYPENIKFYYVQMQDKNTRHHRDNTFTYDDFVSKNIQDLDSKSAKGGGELSPGLWRDKDGVLRDKDGNKVA
jgi:hypothetical protein